MSIKNLDSLFNKLDKLNSVALDGAVSGMTRSLLKTQSDAKINAPTNDGDLKNSIHINIEAEGDTVSGKVYTTNDHAMYVEFGTGPVGEKSKKEIPPGVAIQYKDKGWLIPVEYFPDYKKYGIVAIEVKGALFVPTKGQKAQQFMTTAAKMNDATLGKNVSTEVSKKLKGMSK